MDELLADRVRTLLTGTPGLSEKKMFGGLCFLVNGNMICALTAKDDLMLRVGPENAPALLSHPEARAMDFTGRITKGFLFVSPKTLSNKELADWLHPALTFAQSFPKKNQ